MRKQIFTKTLFAGILAISIFSTSCSDDNNGPNQVIPEEPTEPEVPVEKKFLVSEITGLDYVWSFEYDDTNRLIKIIQTEDKDVTTNEISYGNDGKPSKIYATSHLDTDEPYKRTNTFVYEDGKVIMHINIDGEKPTEGDDDYLSIDADGNVTFCAIEGLKYEYKDKKLFKRDHTRKRYDQNGVEYTKESISTYTYDDKVSMFANINTPNWVLYEILFETYYSNVNNMLSTIETSTNYEANGTVIGQPILEDFSIQYEYNESNLPVKGTSDGVEFITVKYLEAK